MRRVLFSLACKDNQAKGRSEHAHLLPPHTSWHHSQHFEFMSKSSDSLNEPPPVPVGSANLHFAISQLRCIQMSTLWTFVSILKSNEASCQPNAFQHISSPIGIRNPNFIMVYTACKCRLSLYIILHLPLKLPFGFHSSCGQSLSWNDEKGKPALPPIHDRHSERKPGQSTRLS